MIGLLTAIFWVTIAGANVPSGMLATLLIRKSIYHLINGNKDGMALHAAAVSKNGRGIILPGRSGSGGVASSWLTVARSSWTR